MYPDRSTLRAWAESPGKPPLDAFEPETLAALDRCAGGEACPVDASPSSPALTRRRRSWLALLLLLSAAWAMTTGARP